MDIDLGKPVMSSDGERVGTVDSLVLDHDTKEVRQILVRQGLLLSTDRIVDRPMIERIDPDGTVHLNVSSAMVDELPPFVETQYVVAREEELSHLPHAWVTGSGGPPVFWGPMTAGRGYDATAPLYEPASANPPTVEAESNLREDTVVITEGTDVVGRDGDTLGTVDQVIYDEDGNFRGFVVQAGTILHHDVRVPMDWIETITSDRVQLRVTADEAERAGGAA